LPSTPDINGALHYNQGMMETSGQQQLQHLSPCWCLQTHTVSKHVAWLLPKAQ